MRAIVTLTAAALIVGACGATGDSQPGPGSSIDAKPVTVTVWDYYGESTPIKPGREACATKYPWITVDYQAIDWDSTNDKITVGISAGEAPDLATFDMTWIPTLAANGGLEDLSAWSGGQLNGQPITDQYAPGALEAMTFDGKYVTMLYDFDAYSMYYRSDLFEQKGIPVPKTWQELRDAMKQLATDSDGDGKADKYLYAVTPDTFHYSQFLYQNGGSILDQDDAKAVFDDAAGVEALKAQQGFLDDGTGLYWSADEDLIQPLNDESVAVFSNGPYYMGLLKTGVPTQSGKWKIAPAPFAKEPGSYLGGTGLSIPSNAKHKQAAWLLLECLLTPENEVGVFTYAGAAPATKAALASDELTMPDAYFGGDKPFGVFLDAMSTATAFPYVGQWSEIDTAINEALEASMTGQKTPEEALTGAAAEANDLLAK